MPNYDATINLRDGDIRPVFGSMTTTIGTLTVSASPTFTLFDSEGLVVTGYNGIPATGFTATPETTVYAWYLLDTTDPLIIPGTYEAAIAITATASADAIERLAQALVKIVVSSIVTEEQAGFTYDITTDIGKIRSLIVDIDPGAFSFNDLEITTYLDLMGGNIWEGAALLCESYARTRAKLTETWRDADGRAIKRRSIKDWLELACKIREAGIRAGNVGSNGGLATGRIDISYPNDLLDSYRPAWWNVNELPPVD